MAEPKPVTEVEYHPPVPSLTHDRVRSVLIPWETHFRQSWPRKGLPVVRVDGQLPTRQAVDKFGREDIVEVAMLWKPKPRSQTWWFLCSFVCTREDYNAQGHEIQGSVEEVLREFAKAREEGEPPLTYRLGSRIATLEDVSINGGKLEFTFTFDTPIEGMAGRIETADFDFGRHGYATSLIHTLDPNWEFSLDLRQSINGLIGRRMHMTFARGFFDANEVSLWRYKPVKEDGTP